MAMLRAAKHAMRSLGSTAPEAAPFSRMLHVTYKFPFCDPYWFFPPSDGAAICLGSDYCFRIMFVLAVIWKVTIVLVPLNA